MSLVPVANQTEPGWLNKTAMSSSLGISVQAFDKWGVKPVARVGRSVYFTAADVLANRFQNEAAKQQPEFDSEEDLGCGLDFERYRLTKAQADNMEIKNQLSLGTIGPIEMITWVISEVAGEAAGEIDSIPLNIRRKHPALNSRVIEDIKRHCVKAQNAIARVDEKLEATLDDYLTNLNQS